MQPKWSNPSVCPHACDLVLHVWSSPFRQKPKEGFYYAKQRQSEELFHLHSQHWREGAGHQEQHDSFYKEADRICHKEQDHGRCMCPYRFIWKCNGDCIGCEYHAAGDTTSLDQPRPDGNGTLGDYIPDNSKPMDEVIADRMLLEQLFSRLRELDPEADTIIQLWKDHPEGISDRAIARELGRPQKTFADQMKKYRTDLRRITDDK